jgi:hypothetical protein
MLKTKSKPPIKTEIRFSSDNGTYELWCSIDGGKVFRLYKEGIKSQKDALRETTIVTGHYRLWRDLQK